MSKVIGVVADFLTEAHRQQILQTAAPLGYEVRFFRTNREAYGQVEDCEILYGHCQGKLLASAPQLRWFAACYAGVDRMCDEKLYRNPDCILTNASGAYGVTIAEHLIMVLLMLLRRMPEYAELNRAHCWKLLGSIRSLYGSRITVLGTGDIGTCFARRVKAMEPAKVIGVRRTLAPCDPAFDEVHTVEELDSLLPETDILVMCLPGTADTVKLLNRERLALLPSTALVANIGRGSAVDQEALLDALRSGRLAGATLDVVDPEPLPADHPLWDAPNLLLTPHISGNTTLGYTCDRNVAMFCDNLTRYANGQPMAHVVDRKKGY